MHSTNECDDLLIENETESHNFVTSDLHDTIPDTKLTHSLIHKRAASKTKNFSFSCKLPFQNFQVEFRSDNSKL